MQNVNMTTKYEKEQQYSVEHKQINKTFNSNSKRT